MPEIDSRRIADHCWFAVPGWLPILLGSGGLRIEGWRREGRVEVVKNAPHRAVYRVELPEGNLFVKHYRCPRLGDVMRHWLRPCGARREWERIREVARRGIPTVHAVAWGYRRRWGLILDNYLVTRELAGTCTLREHYDRALASRDSARRRALVESVARFVARIHRGGILHNDFHAGNILVAPDPQAGHEGPDREPFAMYLIDLQGVRLGGPLSWPASRDNLAVLDSAWWEDATLAQRYRFWRTYLACRPELRLADRRAAAAQVAQRGREHCLRIHRQRDRRSLRTNRDFVAVKTAEGEAYGIAGIDPEDLKHLLLMPDRILWDNLHRPVKLGHSSVVVEADLPLRGRPCHVALKRYRPRSPLKAVAGCVRPTRGRRSWKAGHALLQRGIATPRPLALWQPRRAGPGRMSYVATEWMEGAENLHLWAWRIAGWPTCIRHRLAARCAVSLGGLAGRMHAFRIAHRDLKASNVLVSERAGRVETALIDVDGMRQGRRADRRRQLGDLVRLAAGLDAHPWVSRTICLRFLRAYAAWLPSRRRDWKRLWREVARGQARQVASKRRRGERAL